MIESPAEDGVGSNLVAVAEGNGEAVALAGGTVVVRRCVQAEKMNRPRKRTAGICFKRNMSDHLILIRRIGSYVSENPAWKFQRYPPLDSLLTSK